MTDGTYWQEQRRFCLKNLRDFGFGKTRMEELIIHEAAAVVKRLRQEALTVGDSGIHMESIFTIPVLSSLWTMITGEGLDHDDPRLLKFMSLLDDFFNNFDMSGSILNYAPFLRFIAPGLSGYNCIKDCSVSIWNYLQVSVL